MSFADVADAAERLSGIARRTPILTSATLDAVTHARVYVKAEELTAGSWVEGLKSGCTFVTNYPLIPEFSVNGEPSGSVLPLTPSHTSVSGSGVHASRTSGCASMPVVLRPSR